MADKLLWQMMIRLKCPISTGNSYSEKTTLECLKVSAHAKQAVSWTLRSVSRHWKSVQPLRMSVFSMMTSGSQGISSLTQLITWKLDFSSMGAVSGSANLCLSQAPWVLSAILKLLSLIILNLTATLQILLRNLFLFAPSKTSHIKSNIPSNGLGIISKVFSLKDRMKLENMSKILLDTSPQSTENSETNHQCSVVV